DREQITQLSAAITSHWYQARDLVKQNSFVLALPQGSARSSSATTVHPDCQVPANEIWNIADILDFRDPVADDSPEPAISYASLCTTLHRINFSTAFTAHSLAQLSASALSRSALWLPYEIMRIGQGDAVALAIIALRSINPRDLRNGSGCGTQSFRTALALFETAMLEGDVIAPNYFSIMLACDRLDGGGISPTIRQRIPALADSGDPFAHALIAYQLEREGQNYDDALAHYLASAIILNRVKAQFSDDN